MSSPPPSPGAADWIGGGQGASPSLNWSFVTEGALTAMCLARESGETFVADNAGVLCRLDRKGRIGALTRLHEPVRALAWSDDGRFGAALCGEETLHFFDHVLNSQWKATLRDVPLAVAIAPYGSHVLVTCANATNRVYDAGKSKVTAFETIRPLAFARFIPEETAFVAAAEHGLICECTLMGQQVWTEKLWSNVGQLEVAGDGSLSYLACFGHGIQVFDGDGGNVGAYVLDGTVNHVAVSFEPHRIVSSTVERSLYWLDADGELLWSTTTPDDVTALQCDPLGEWILCGLQSGRVLRLDWTISRDETA